MPVQRLRGWRLAVGVGVLGLAAVLVALVLTRGPDAPQTFGPWYPLTDQAGARASADFENHVRCTVDDPPVAECQRVKLGVVLYGTPDAPSTYLISIVRVGTGDENRRPRPGTAAYGYALSSIPIGQTVQAPG